MASVGEYLIIFAQVGYASTGEFSKLWSYNTITGVWSRHKKPIEIKFSRLPHWICKLGDLVYMFGGQIVGCRNYREYITSVVSFDITHDKWSTVYTRADNYGDDDDGDDDDDDDPPEMELSLLFYHCGSLYIQGKIDEYENLCGMYKFCLETSKWSLVPQNGQTPRFKYIVHGTVYNNQLYCFGKRRGVTNGFREIPIFDFTTNTWTTRATIAKNQQYPDDRAAASYTFWENFAYMSGGIVGDSRSVSDIWRMDLETLEWLKLDSLQTGEYHHLMSVVDDCYLYSFGANGQGLDFFDKFERFTLRPPSLYLLSLETVCRSPNMSSLISSLPSDIVDKHKLNDNNSS